MALAWRVSFSDVRPDNYGTLMLDFLLLKDVVPARKTLVRFVVNCYPSMVARKTPKLQ